MSVFENSRAYKVELPEARTFEMQGTLWRVLAAGADTGGVVGALDERCAHGVAAPMHTHEREDEVFYVLDGKITFFVGKKGIEATAGTFIYLPRFVPHGFRVDSTEARVFNFVTPAGFERIVLDRGKPRRYDDIPAPVRMSADQKPPTKAQVDSMLEQYGMRINSGPTPPHPVS